MTGLCGLRVSTLLLLVCLLAWTGWIVGHVQGRRAMRKRLRRTLDRAGSRFGEDL